MKPKMCCCLVPAAIVELLAVALLLTLVTSLALRQLQSQRVAHLPLAVQPRAQAPVTYDANHVASTFNGCMSGGEADPTASQLDAAEGSHSSFFYYSKSRSQ